MVDELQLDVFVFGILTDFRSELFPGSARLVELADRTHVLQVEALCWCGKRATHNARTEDGVMVVEGEVIVVGDVEQAGSQEAAPEVAYEVLCRQHHRRRMTAARAHAVALGRRAAAVRLTSIQGHPNRPFTAADASAVEVVTTTAPQRGKP